MIETVLNMANQVNEFIVQKQENDNVLPVVIYDFP